MLYSTAFRLLSPEQGCSDAFGSARPPAMAAGYWRRSLQKTFHGSREVRGQTFDENVLPENLDSGADARQVVDEIRKSFARGENREVVEGVALGESDHGADAFFASGTVSVAIVRVSL